MDYSDEKILKDCPLCVECQSRGYYRKSSKVRHYINGTVIALCDACYSPNYIFTKNGSVTNIKLDYPNKDYSTTEK